MEAKAEKSEALVRTIETQVLVASAQPGMLIERMKLCNELWAANVKVSCSKESIIYDHAYMTP